MMTKLVIWSAMQVDNTKIVFTEWFLKANPPDRSVQYVNPLLPTI
jgi:hypothetical protein